MKPNWRSPWVALVALILLAFALRMYHLGASSLNGDEAFTIRYWADSPSVVLSHLAWVEPHPFGAFFGFWAWKSLVGDSEFAMRMLPVLINIIGVPALYAFARRLLYSTRVALIAAFLWAINPNLIWHSQDVRNYALWSGLSILSLWLLLRASDRSRPLRRIDWILYVISVTLGLYVFFLEAFVVIVHGLYVAWFRRKALRAWLLAIVVVGVLLIPWVGQVWALAHSYGGTGPRADFGVLFEQFLPALLFGEAARSPLATLFDAFVVGVFILHLAAVQTFYPGRAQKVLLLLLSVPTALLFIAATRLNVFRPRYLIAITPAILLPLANTAAILGRGLKRYYPMPLRSTLLIGLALLGPFALQTADALSHYYASPHNATDWRGLGIYLRANVKHDDLVIMTASDPSTGSTDPAFEYYYRGPAPIIPLPHPDYPMQSTVDQALATHQSVWLIPVGAQTESIDQALLVNGMLIGEQQAGSFKPRQYRSKTIKPSEIDAPLNLSIGGGLLTGYSLLGEQRVGSTLTVLLFWQRPPTENLKTFVHLIGSPKADGSPVWAQNDHVPSAPGRDVYPISLTAVIAGSYTLEIGLYGATTGQRSTVIDAGSGKVLGDSYTLTSITISP
ncbi:MAG: glycosyltransferase family 39 protein [Chloroflexota bacterium]